MTTPTPGERLRAAADLIEQRAAESTTAYGPWWADQDEDDDPVIAVTIDAEKHHARVLFMADWATGGDARWVALMAPHLAAPLAALLRGAATNIDRYLSPIGAGVWHHELAIADQILGGDQ